MCGISVFYDKKNRHGSSVIFNMLEALRHRGPDSSGIKEYSFFSGTLYMGASRLRIADPHPRSDQPFISENENFCLIYNGEIYNSKNFDRNEKIFSDTRVLFSQLIEKGESIIPLLNGMYAFSFFNRSENKLIICRDPAGIKPLFYYEDDEVFLASSEIRGIFASGLLKKELNPEAIPHYLLYKYVESPNTFYKGVRELPSGCILKLVHNGTFLSSFKGAFVSPGAKYEQINVVDKCGGLLEESIMQMYPTDVSAGVMYSGGIDSSLMLAYAAKNDLSLPAFTIACKTADSSFKTSGEKLASQYARALGQEHHLLNIDSSSLKSFFDYMQVVDQPIADSAGFLTWILSKYMKQHVDVVFSGAGADEYFGGYHRHQAFNFYLNHFYGHECLIKTLSGLSGLLPDGFDHPLREKFRLIKKFLSGIEPNSERTWRNFTAVKGFDFLLYDYKDTSELKKALLIQAFEEDRSKYLVSDILSLTDQFSMQHSLEVRLPFLNQNMVNFAENLSPEILLKNGKKWILKKLLLKETNGKVQIGSKEGFGMPIGAWIRENQNRILVDQVLDKENILYRYIDYKRIYQLVHSHLNFKHDHSTALWSLLILTAWLDKEFSR